MPSGDAAETLLRRFAAGVAHELNNSLTAVLGIADLVARDPQVDPAVRENIDLVVEHAREIAALSRRLTSFSRGEQAAGSVHAEIESLLGKPLPQVDVSAPLPSAAQVVERSGDTILLVEDEEVVRTILTWQLEGLGYRIVSAASASEGLARHAEERARVAAAVLDLVLPDFDGLELCRRMRMADADLPVVMLSGLPPAAAPTSETLLWLAKPVALGALQQALRQVTGRT